MNVFILKHDHKHGADITVHSSYDGARFYGNHLMREMTAEWGEDEAAQLSDDELWSAWTELSGETEFFSIEEHSVRDSL
jgi:hypothetical protein